MKEEIQAIENPQAADVKPAGFSRPVYTSPTLVQYGALSELTQGTSLKNGEASRSKL